MPSSQALRQVAADPNASINALQPTGSRLAVLDETCALENAPSNASSGSSTTQGDQKDQPGRLRRASQAITSRFGLRKDNKETPTVIPPTGTAVQNDQYWDYNSEMVDVLDTIGESYRPDYTLAQLMIPLFRSRSPDPHIPHQRPELIVYS